MSDPTTVRERVIRASQFFAEIDAVVLTTFNLNAAFLEDSALPAVFALEARTNAARRAELDKRLGETACTVFYDPSAPPKITGRFRFVARPVPIPGRLFHPKLVVLAGRDEDEVEWVYLAVSSANLTQSGWGRNAESFAETWIHTRTQQSWTGLDTFLAWLQTATPLGETPDRADAVARARAVLGEMPRRNRFPEPAAQPWSGTLHAEFYASPQHSAGLPGFLREGRVRAPARLRAHSPYWGDAANQVAAFGAAETILVPALGSKKPVPGLDRAQATLLPPAVKIHRNRDDVGARFWHLKAYALTQGNHTDIAIGSCNFTRAGLSGADGNVEAMLVYRGHEDWLPAGTEIDRATLPEEPTPEEETPSPVPLAVVVAWDWRDRCWRWWLKLTSRQSQVVLTLAGLPSFSAPEGTHRCDGLPPSRGARYEVTWREAGVDHRWEGLIVELNLDHSPRRYGRGLSASEILESWRGRAPGWDTGRTRDGNGETEDGEGDGDSPTPAAFDAVNLYDMYRAARARRTELRNTAKPGVRRALLVGRPTSVVAMAHLAAEGTDAPVVRYLVMRELVAILDDWAGELEDDELLEHIRALTAAARELTEDRLRREVQGDALTASRMLDWFEARLTAMDQGVA